MRLRIEAPTGGAERAGRYPFPLRMAQTPRGVNGPRLTRATSEAGGVAGVVGCAGCEEGGSRSEARPFAETARRFAAVLDAEDYQSEAPTFINQVAGTDTAQGPFL